MINETHPYYIMASFSPDGLRWTEGPNNPILRHNAVEPTGLIKHGGRYLLNGQGGNVGTKRALVTFVSYDFDHWSDAVVLGFRRDQAPHRQLAGCHAGEQVHLGAGLWDRGNVVLGVYGMWHGESNDRRINAQGISPRNRLRATLLDDRMRPIPGYTAEDCVPLETEGLSMPVRWRGRELVKGVAAPFMLRVDWDAERPEDVFLYAAYVTE